MAARAAAGPIWSQQSGASSESQAWLRGPKHLGHPSLPCQKAGSDAEWSRHEQAHIRNAGVAGGGLTHQLYLLYHSDCPSSRTIAREGYCDRLSLLFSIAIPYEVWTGRHQFDMRFMLSSYANVIYNIQAWNHFALEKRKRFVIELWELFSDIFPPFAWGKKGGWKSVVSCMLTQ